MPSKKTTSHERRVQAYLPPKLHGLVVAYCERTGASQSEAVVDAVRTFFESINVTHFPAFAKKTA